LTPANPRTGFQLSKSTVPAVYQSRSLENNENGLQMVPSQALMFVVLAVGLSAPLKRACRQKRRSGVRKGVRSGVFNLCVSRPIGQMPFLFPFPGVLRLGNFRRLPARSLGFLATCGGF
jgi:hypothetical protein